MIEHISTGDDSEDKGKVNLIAKFPKNIRQVGQADVSRRIYIEDYVITFIKQSAISNKSDIIILLGSSGPVEGIYSTFVNGAIRIDSDNLFESEKIETSMWDKIYATTTEFFDGYDIVGWGCVSSDDSEDDGYGFMKKRLCNIHTYNFPGSDKLLLMYDSVLKEESFYRLVGGELKRQRGHYIYYERNDKMQEYMMSINETKSFEDGYSDEITAKIRNVANKKSANKEQQEDGIKHGVIHVNEKETLSYGKKIYSGIMVAAVFALAIAAVKSNDNSMQKIKSVFKTQNNSDKNVGKNTPTLAPKDDPVKVEDVEGVTPTPIVQTDKPEQDKDETDKNTQTPDDGQEQSKDEDKNNNGESDKNTQNKDESQVGEGTTGQDKDEKEEIQKPDEHTQTGNIGNYYQVIDGDTLAGISVKIYGNTSMVEKLCKINSIEDENMIHPGDKLLLP